MANDNCPVAALLGDFEAAVLRFNQLDEAGSRMGDDEGQGPIDAVWDRLRALETRAMKAVARSENGRTLQLMLAVVEANTLGAFAGENPGSALSNARLRATLRSLMAARDVSGIPMPVLEFYLGNLVKRLWPEPEPDAPQLVH